MGLVKKSCLHKVASAILMLPALLMVENLEAATPTESIIMPKAHKSLLLDVDMHGNRLVMVGERGHVLVSEDSGKTWKQSKSPVSQMLTAVELLNERYVWAVGHDGNIIHSDDGGLTWVKQRDGLKAQAEANVVLLREAKEKFAQLEEQVAQDPVAAAQPVAPLPATPAASDALAEEEMEAPVTLQEKLEEAEWEVNSAQERLKGPVVANPLMDVWFANEREGWAVGAFGALVQTVDGGKNWISRSKDIGNPNNYHLNAINGAPDGTIYVAGESGFLIVSKDKGQSWTRVDLGYQGTLFGIVVDRSGAMVVVTGLRGNTFRTQDGGGTWHTINPGVDYSLAAGSIYDNRLVLVGTGGYIALSEDAGDTFKQYTLLARSGLSSAVALDKNRFLLVGQGGFYIFDAGALSR